MNGITLHPTTAASGASGSAVIVVLWIVSLLPKSWGITMTPEVAVALAAIVSGVVGAQMRRLATKPAAAPAEAAPAQPAAQ